MRAGTWLFSILGLLLVVLVLALGTGMMHMRMKTTGTAQSLDIAFATPSTQQPADLPMVSILSQPRLSPSFIDQVLTSYGSPAQGQGQILYDLGQKYQVNSDLALAFFCHESSCGTQGEAVITHSLGNVRCIPVPREADGCVDQDRGGYAYFTTWERGFEAWYRLIKNLYVKTWNLTTLPDIIHKYAPAADHNDEVSYVREVLAFLSAWYQGRMRP